MEVRKFRTIGCLQGARSSLGNVSHVYRSPLGRRAVEGLEHAGLAERVVATEERRLLAAHRRGEVAPLRRVACVAGHVDPLRGAVGAMELDPGRLREPRIGWMQLALRADCRQLRTEREVERTVELPEPFAAE